MIFFSI